MNGIELLEKCQQGDKAAREQMITENVGLVWSIVRRFLGRGCEADDLFQIGTIGLIKAIDKFDLSYEVQFSTYAVPMIAGEIKRFLRDDGIIKVSRSLKENAWKIRQATEKLEYELGREVSLDELANATGLKREDVVLAMEAGTEVESLYRTVYQKEGNEVYLVDQVVQGGSGGGCVAKGVGKEDREKENLVNHLMLEQLMKELTPKERELLQLRYYEDKTQVWVAKHFGVSQVQISREEKKILKKMRELAR